ncbi:MAG: hypothetical protein ACPKM0_00920 [Pleomorphochaeta sp.]
MIKDKLSIYFFDNWKPKLISLILALCVFSFFHYYSHSSRFVTIPLQVVLPSDYEAESLIPTSVEVEIIGDNNIIYLIDPNLIVAVIDFSTVNREGISRTNVKLNYNETVFSQGNIDLVTNPESVKVSFKLKE